jgi:hypothetical protein
MFALQAGPLKQQFLDGHLPEDFIEKLNAAVQDLEQKIKDQAFSKGTRLAATVAIEQARNEALPALQRLDPVIENILRDDPPTLAIWESARHVERYGVSKSAETEAPPAPPSPNPPVTNSTEAAA